MHNRLCVLSADDFCTDASFTGGIQEAIDALPESGGVVLIPPGRRLLRRSVRLRSGVTLRGEGPASVLARPAEIDVPLAEPTDGSRTSCRVARLGGLKVGDQIAIRDRENYGWWVTHAVIKSIRGCRLGLGLLHGKAEYRYLPRRGGRVSNWLAAIWLRDVHDVTIEGLTIQGSAAPRRKVYDFVVAAVHSRNAQRLRVADVTIRDWPGDGIGVQGGREAIVSGCIVENCAGHGFHPGTGLTESCWSGNIARGNTRDGLFFCLRVSHTVVRGNVFVGNGGHGIGGLTDPDRDNVVADNICADNGCHGIDADKAVAAVITGNLCRNNSRRRPGRFAGIYLAGHRDCAVTGNICIDDQDSPTQRRGISIGEPGGDNLVANNHCRP